LTLAATAPAASSPSKEVVGRSVQGRAIELIRVGDHSAREKILVVGCIHGDEPAGIAVVRRLRIARPPAGVELLLVPTINPDGLAAGTRLNAHGADLNRNFPSGWRAHGSPGNPFYSGPRPLSEPETRIAVRLIKRFRPRVTIWYHQHLRLVVRTGGDVSLERRYARRVGLPLRRLPNYPGTAPRWQNSRLPGSTAFVVELPAGRLSPRAAALHARAVLSLAQTRPL
jgi:protein MpaA